MAPVPLALLLAACSAPPVAAGRPLGLTYEIYVRSYQDSDGDGIGDLEGVRQRLDHVGSLGVRTIWLMPVFPAVGPAGYDVTDYDQVRDDYGDEADLAALVDDAHALGMRVLLDLPLNHVARTHPWFTGPDTDQDDPDRARFVFADTDPGDTRWHPAADGGWYYGYFGADLPDVDWEDGVTRERLLGVFDTWLDLVDGYRLDAVPELVEEGDVIDGSDATHVLLAELHERVAGRSDEKVLLAEACAYDAEEGARYLGTVLAPESDRYIDFPRRDALLASLDEGDPGPLMAWLDAERAAGSLGRTSPFLQSHDLSRLPSDVPDAAARRLLRVLLLTLPGDPILYYGEELDLADATTATGQDYAWRAPMAWDSSANGGFTTASVAWLTPDPGYLDGKNVADAEADPTSTLHLLRGLGCLRAGLDEASFDRLSTSDASLLAFERGTDTGRLLVVANLASTPVTAAVGTTGPLLDLVTGARVGGEALAVGTLPGFGYRVYVDGVGEACTLPGQAGYAPRFSRRYQMMSRMRYRAPTPPSVITV